MAANRKDFSAANTGRVYSAIEQSTSKRGQQGEASPQEAEERKEALKTQGRKGVRAVRINMAFSPQNHDFVRIMSKASGLTMTEFVNAVISAYQREHPEIMQQAQQFINTVNTGAITSLFGDQED